MPSISPLCILHLEAIKLESNFWNIYHMTKFQETYLHKPFSTWVTAGMQLEGNQMCAGSSLGVPGTPCASASWVLPQPLERDAHRWKALWANATCQLLGF